MYLNDLAINYDSLPFKQINRARMVKITFLVVCLIAICIEFQEISACTSGCDCKKDSWKGCDTDGDCCGGTCID